PRGGGGDDPKGPPKDDPKDKAPTLDDMRKKVEERGVDYAARMLLEMSEDNYKSRSRIRDLEARIPGEGTLVLKGDDVKKYERFKALGDPADVERRLSEGDEARTWKAGRMKQDRLSEVASLHGWKPSVLQRL